jgi:TolB-like protein
MEELRTKAPESLQQVAHDCDNHLACVLGLLSLARQLRPEDQELPVVLADAESAASELHQDIKRLFHAKPWALLLALAAAFFLDGAAWAGGFKSLAQELSEGARKADMTRVAVLPFEPVDGSKSREGWSIAENLTTQLVRAGRIQTIERSLLKKLIDEHSLARTGLIEAASVKKLGAVLAVDGIISGSFVTMGRRVKVNARVVRVETGLIVSACEAEYDRELFDMPGLFAQTGAGSSSFPDVPAPVLEGWPPPGFSDLFADEGLQLRDAPAAEFCADAAERVDRMERDILELKARYWAMQLHKGVDSASLKANPGSTITNPDLKRQFYDRMKYWYAQETIPELTPPEVKRFINMDRRAFALHQECGI